MATASGLNDYDYQNLANLTLGLKNVNQLELVSKIPVPPEILEHYTSNLKQTFLINAKHYPRNKLKILLFSF